MAALWAPPTYPYKSGKALPTAAGEEGQGMPLAATVLSFRGIRGVVPAVEAVRLTLDEWAG